MTTDATLTVEQVAERLHMHPHTVYKLIRRGALRAFRPAGTKRGVRVRSEDFDIYVATSEDVRPDLLPIR